MLSFEFFIARRELLGRKKRNSLSGSIVSIVVFGIALCVAVMIVSISILTGFKKEIQDKVIGFGSHIQIVRYDSNLSFETQPISSKQPFINDILKTPGVTHIQRFATKMGIIKAGVESEGIVLKGVGGEYDWKFFTNNIVDGSLINVNDSSRSNDILISAYLAKRLKIKSGDKIAMYFVQNPPRMRAFTVKGIYETSLMEFDKLFVFCDIKHIVKLQDGWKEEDITGFEVLVDNFDDIDRLSSELYNTANMSIDNQNDPVKVVSIKEKYPHLFDWLNLQDINITVFLSIMLAVAGFNMISGLLILILESTNMIGLLKAIGAANHRIRNIFIIESVFLTLKGLFWGNLIGLSLCFIQKYTHLIKLNGASYYISYVPINIDFSQILLLNIGVVFVVFLFLLLPSLIIAGLDPVKAIRYN